MTLQLAHRLSFGSYQDIFVCYTSQLWMRSDKKNGSPRRSFIIPRIPDTLDTRFPPSSGPSLSLISPLGLSITNVGAAGDEGEVKA